MPITTDCLIIWVTNFERELFALYLNDGGGFFSHSSRGAGIAAFEGLYVGFGTVMVDLDLDGDRDIVTANGHVSYHSPGAAYRQLPLLLKNVGEGSFPAVASGRLLRQNTHRSRTGLCRSG